MQLQRTLVELFTFFEGQRRVSLDPPESQERLLDSKPIISRSERLSGANPLLTYQSTAIDLSIYRSLLTRILQTRLSNIANCTFSRNVFPSWRNLLICDLTESELFHRTKQKHGVLSWFLLFWLGWASASFCTLVFLCVFCVLELSVQME